MHENSGNSIIFYWHYTTDGVSTAGLTVTVDVYEVTRDGTSTLVVDDGACTEVGAGIYRYLLASGTVDAAAEYIAVAHTATATVDAQDIPSMWVIDRAGTNDIPTIKLKTDLLDVSSVSVSSAISGTTITILRGDTFECSISDLGSLASYVSLDFTVKADKSDADTAALIRIRLNASGLEDGLLTLNGAVPSNASDGSIAITDAATGDITITLAASCTDDLPTGTYAYDVQLIEVGDVSTLTSGKASVTADVTRAVS
jgi:hypothetical protein